MERVTVRMSRGDRSTPWGFGVTEAPNRDVIILNVVGGSLADRAGLRNGDVIETLEDLTNLDINAVDRLLVTSRDKIELVVHRQPSGEARVWRPDIQATEMADRPYKVNLQHTGENRAPAGFNSPAVPFDPRVKHLQYNSPMGLYSNENVAESYVQQTQAVTNGMKQMNLQSQQTPAYLNSETLRVLKEQEAGRSSLGSHPNPNNLPVCFICTRPILGVMARVGGQEIHGDCLKCSTCGNSLRNIGHHLIDGKLYCDIHGQQRKGLSSARMNENLSVRTTPTYSNPVPIQENVRAAYQPEGLRKETHVHVGTPKTQGPISPSNRGVPTNTIYADRKPENYESQYKSSVYSQQQAYAPPPQVYAPPPQQAPPPPPANPPPVVDTSSSLGRNTSGKSDSASFTRSTFERNEKRENVQSGIRKEGSLNTTTGRVPVCEACKQNIRGAFVLATGLAWCPEHFVCANGKCGRRLLECGFVEENGEKYCEQCFESYIAPRCNKCTKPIISDCLNALQKKWHPTCFTCAHCHKPFGNAAFYLENGLAYCEQDWNSLFTTKCVNCNYAIEAGDRWVEALGSAFHSNCFNCTRCHINLEGESFFAKNGQPFCKQHA